MPRPIANGHGTLVAGVVAQFVPQATLVRQRLHAQPRRRRGHQRDAARSYIYNRHEVRSTQHPLPTTRSGPDKVDRDHRRDLRLRHDPDLRHGRHGLPVYPQLALDLKGQLTGSAHLGIAPFAAAGQFGSPNPVTATGTAGDINGMSLPAILNEAISVTGTYPFPYTTTAPTRPSATRTRASRRGPSARLSARHAQCRAGSQLNFAGEPARLPGAGHGAEPSAAPLVAGDLILFNDKVLVGANRNITTDFAAPAIDVPTFTPDLPGDNTDNHRPQTSSRDRHVALDGHGHRRSYAVMVPRRSITGPPCQVDRLHGRRLPDPAGRRDHPELRPARLHRPRRPTTTPTASTRSSSGPPCRPPTRTTPDSVPPAHSFSASTDYRTTRRINVSNAIAAIEGTVALNYLFATTTFRSSTPTTTASSPPRRSRTSWTTPPRWACPRPARWPASSAARPA